MSTHPYIPLYVDDYEAATAHLSIEEDGVYTRLLRLCWRTPGCSLPNDPAWIARKIRLSPEAFDRIAKPVIDEFFREQRGRLVQRRLKAEYDDISRKKSARKQAGKKGGDAKARKTQGNSASNASVLPADTGAFPEPYPEPEPDNTSEPKGSSVARRKARTAIPANWLPGVKGMEFAMLHGIGPAELEREILKFVGHHTANGKTMADWAAAWRTWVLNAETWRKEREPVRKVTGALV